jgi:hypothetical protein
LLFRKNNPNFLGTLLGFPNRVLRTRFHPQRLGHFAPLSFTAYGGKIQATRFAFQWFENIGPANLLYYPA